MSQSANTQRRVSAPQATAYGVGSLGTSTFIVVPQLLLLFFMTEVLAIPTGWATLAIFLPKLWEFVSDPIIGGLSDRFDTRWGRRRPLMLIGGVLFAIGFAAMFAVPDFEAWPARFAYVAGLFILCTTAYTVYAIPYIAMPAEMTADYDERTRIVSYRMVFVSLGVLLAGTLAPWLVSGGTRADYATMGLIIGGVALIACLVSVAGTRNVAFTQGADSPLPWAAQMASGWSHRPFRHLCGIFILQMFAISLMLVVLPYFSTYALDVGENGVALFFVLLTVATLLSMPFWVGLSRRMGKRIAFMTSTAVQVAGMVLLAGASSHLAFFWTGAVIAGIGNAGVQLFPFAMLPELIDADRDRTGQNREGLFTGIWVAGEKFGLALGVGAVGALLALSGFRESEGEVSVTQTDNALLVIHGLMWLAPSLIFAASLYALSLYREPGEASGQEIPS